MTNGIPPDWPDPAFGTTWTEILPDYKFPKIAIQVREILRGIRDHSTLTPAFKQQWIRAIASIFEEGNIRDIIYNNPLDRSMLDSKIKEAEKSLNDVINSATDSERNRYHMEDENEKIIDSFKDFIVIQQQGIHETKS